MTVEYTRRFLKELAAVAARERVRIEQFVFETLPAAASVAATGQLEKLSGYDTFLRAHFGDYQVGFRLTPDTIVCERVLHRKEIYKYFL